MDNNVNVNKYWRVIQWKILLHNKSEPAVTGGWWERRAGVWWSPVWPGAGPDFLSWEQKHLAVSVMTRHDMSCVQCEVCGVRCAGLASAESVSSSQLSANLQSYWDNDQQTVSKLGRHGKQEKRKASNNLESNKSSPLVKSLRQSDRFISAPEDLIFELSESFH